tara:strand:+ start:157 stop:1707 length:1551 start_codon:yes stop_codon:yes gene_type:complete
MRKAQTPPLHDIKADYEISKRHGRFRRTRKGVAGVGTTGDFHFRNESEWLYSIEYARDLDRNDSVAGMIVDRLIDNILQDVGIRPDPCTGDENADAFLKQRWKEWSEDEDQCDLAGEMTFAEMERAVLRGTLVDGDILPVANDAGTLEIMEAHRCRTPSNTKRNVVYGVELDEHRKRLRYLFTRDELDPRRALRKVSDTVPVDARDSGGNRQVFHVFDPSRVSQTRGMSAFRRVADTIGMHDDIEFAELVRHQIASCFAVFRKKAKASPLGGGQYGPRTTETTGSYSRTLENIGPGMEIDGEPGEELTGFSPNTPGSDYLNHITKVLKTVCANLGIPFQAVFLDPSQTNFSGWRGALDQARMGYRRVQTWMIRKFHRRVYNWKVRTWLAESSELQAWHNQDGVDVFRHKWSRPSWEYVQPLQDAAADVTKVKSGITTLRKVHSSRGDDFDEVIVEGVSDNAKWYRLCRDAAREINAEAEDESEQVSWRELLAMPLHDNVKMTLDMSSQEAESNAIA